MPKKTPFHVVFFGTSVFAVPILQALVKDGDFDIVSVVTQPDKPAGRHKALQAPPVKRVAETLGISIFQPESLRTKETKDALAEMKADVFVVAAYGKILPKSVLEMPAHGSVNIHGSLLPKYRGASPISSAIIAGETHTGITIMQMDEKMDEGPILALSDRLPVSDDDTTETLSRKLETVSAEMIHSTLKLYLAGQLKPVPQDHTKATYTKILKRENGLINWSKSAEEIERMIRALHPWPGTYTTWKRGEKGSPKLLIKAADVLHPDAGCGPGLVPGRISRMNDGSMGIDCGKGCLKLEKVQLEGKNETDGSSFLNGYPDIAGQILGK